MTLPMRWKPEERGLGVCLMDTWRASVQFQLGLCCFDCNCKFMDRYYKGPRKFRAAEPKVPTLEFNFGKGVVLCKPT